jgi:hypothetical protein
VAQSGRRVAEPLRRGPGRVAADGGRRTEHPRTSTPLQRCCSNEHRLQAARESSSQVPKQTSAHERPTQRTNNEIRSARLRASRLSGWAASDALTHPMALLPGWRRMQRESAALGSPICSVRQHPHRPSRRHRRGVVWAAAAAQWILWTPTRLGQQRGRGCCSSIRRSGEVCHLYLCYVCACQVGMVWVRARTMRPADPW